MANELQKFLKTQRERENVINEYIKSKYPDTKITVFIYDLYPLNNDVNAYVHGTRKSSFFTSPKFFEDKYTITNDQINNLLRRKKLNIILNRWKKESFFKHLFK